MNEKRFERVARLVTHCVTAYADASWTQIITDDRPYHGTGWSFTPAKTLIAKRFTHDGTIEGNPHEADELNVMVWTGSRWRMLNRRLIAMIELALWPKL